MHSQQGEQTVTVSKAPSYMPRQKPSRKVLIMVALIFGVIGGIILLRSFAATPPVVASIEAEQMTLPPGASIITDSSTPGGSGKAIKMVANGSVSGNVILSAPGASLTVTAHGDKCRGDFADFSVSIDGKNVLSEPASSNGWQNYSATLPLTAAAHSIVITGSNIIQENNCDRPLYLDVTTFYGAVSTPTVTPAPTVSFSATPSSITAGQSSTLTWSSTNATSCTASGAWSGAQLTSGSKPTGALNATATYNLSCTGPGGTTPLKSVTVTVGSTTTTSSGHVYWGAWIDGSTYGSSSDAPWNTTAWDTFENHAGKKVSIDHYGQPPMWKQAFAASNINTIVSRGAIPLMDMSSESIPLTDITAGKYDSSIVTWADAVKANGKPFFFRWNWEMNGTWFNWGAQAKQNPAAFVAAWKHMHDVVASRGANNVTWVWCPNTIYNGGTDMGSLYPGDSYVDWTCFDGYNKGPLDGDYWRSFTTVAQDTYNKLLTIAPNKPIMIGETASNENGGSKSSWITDALQAQLPANFPKVKAVVWFNWPIYENNVNQQWQIESSTTAQDAFKAGINFKTSTGTPYYAGNNYVSLPPLTKVQPLP